LSSTVSVDLDDLAAVLVGDGVLPLSAAVSVAAFVAGSEDDLAAPEDFAAPSVEGLAVDLVDLGPYALPPPPAASSLAVLRSSRTAAVVLSHSWAFSRESLLLPTELPETLLVFRDISELTLLSNVLLLSDTLRSTAPQTMWTLLGLPIAVPPLAAEV